MNSWSVMQPVGPFTNAPRAVPLFAWLPLLSVWFGIDQSSGRILIFHRRPVAGGGGHHRWSAA